MKKDLHPYSTSIMSLFLSLFLFFFLIL
uniref:Uncharacterized protein n=1 Tax=Rhizophora mucronata TaxID=61149 RepID=A0A2P2PBI1_RHIMU